MKMLNLWVGGASGRPAETDVASLNGSVDMRILLRASLRIKSSTRTCPLAVHIIWIYLNAPELWVDVFQL